MNRLIKTICCLFLPAVTFFSVMAQESRVANTVSATSSFSGQVVDEQGIGIEFATVILLQGEKQIAGTISDSTGYFSIQTDEGEYFIIIQCIGYEPIRESIRLSEPEKKRFVLKSSVFTLKEVVIQAHNIERKADRFIVSVSPSAGKDGTELLMQAPGVWLTDDQISINGTQGTKVFVDHREIKLKGAELLAYLHSLRSENIRRIEVIPIAGAAYSADTRGGVIHIFLRNRQENGLQGSVSSGVRLAALLQQYIPSFTFNSRIGKWNLNSAFSGAFTPENKGHTFASRTYKDENIRFISHSDLNARSNYGTGRIGTIFEIDTMNSIGMELEYIRQSFRTPSESRTEISKTGIHIDSEGEYFQRNSNRIRSATLNILHKTDNRGSVIKFLADYTQKDSEGKNDYAVSQTFAGMKQDSIYRSNADATYKILTSDLSYTKNTLLCGLKYTYISMNDNSRYEGLSKGKWYENPSYGHRLHYQEKIAAAYATIATEVGKWSISGGLRDEYSHTDDRNGRLNRNYFDLFPNLNISYAFDRIKKWMIIGQFARNIERPPFHSLNSNRIQISDYSYIVGNPLLKPTYINRLNATLVYNYRYTLTIGGNLHHNLIREFIKQDASDPEVSFVTYENHHAENHWFVAINLPFQPARWCNLTANFVGVRQDIRVHKANDFVNHFLYFANANATFLLPADYTLEIQYNGISRLYSGNGEVAPRHVFDLVARKKIGGKHFLLTASVNNLFDRQQKFRNYIDTYTVDTYYATALSGRTFKLSLVWNFNSGKKIKKTKIESSSAAEKGRMEKK